MITPDKHVEIRKNTTNDMINKIIDLIMTILPFFGGRKKRKEMMEEVQEFSELVKNQYGFLMDQVEKVLKDYFDLSARVKEMHAEIFELKAQLSEALSLQCGNKECNLRKRNVNQENHENHETD